MAGTAALRVFISYRRDDTAGHAGRLHDSLSASFEEADVFMDVGDIEPGVDFTVAIADAIGSCDVMLALIGTRWASATAANGRRRLDDPDDHVVMEIATALERGVRVIPTLIDGASMPDADALPPRIADLSRRNAVQLSTVTWYSDFETLVAALRRMLPPSAEPARAVSRDTALGASAGSAAPLAAEDHHPRKGSFPRWAVLAAVAAVLLVLVVSVAGQEDSGGPGSATEAKQLVVEPDSGPPGTTIEVRGGPCRRPDGWHAGQIYFGLHDPRAADEATLNPDKAEITLDPSSPWRGQLTIPATASRGDFGVYANCWALDPNGTWSKFDEYLPATFTVR